ncbi:hypothetical protein H8356DRAFT_1345146 [Neocallimastix lanati (nom. inval.)]|nr:hypothetical protein H8356DRAFT_1345146 [Neocallimastix sp. JGI-2020a]
MEKRKKIEKSETNRRKEHIIINNMDKYNFSKTKKDNSKVYRCIEYKTSNKLMSSDADKVFPHISNKY